VTTKRVAVSSKKVPVVPTTSGLPASPIRYVNVHFWPDPKMHEKDRGYENSG
jgi:hypothetical protein